MNAGFSRRTLFIGGACTLSALLALQARAQEAPKPEEMQDFLAGFRGEVRFRPHVTMPDFERPPVIEPGLDVRRLHAVSGFTEQFGEAPRQDVLLSLAQSIGSPRSAMAMMEGASLQVGEVAYLVITSVAYHEETDESGDIVSGWPGYLAEANLRPFPRETFRMQPFEDGFAASRVREAWVKAIAEGDYVEL